MRSQVETLQAIGQAQRLLLAGLPFLLFLGLGVGYFLADSALKPVDELTLLTNHIAQSGKFQERLPESKGNDEMARLSRTFNKMLAKLETSLEREKAFALAAAHELKTPLSLLQGRSSLSLEKVRSIAHYQKALKQIYSTSVQMNDMIDMLLAIARTHQNPSYESLDLAALLKEEADSFVKTHESNLTLELQSGELKVLGNKVALQLVIQNLIANALKYGRVGGTVYLHCGSFANEAFIEVSDDGEGIPEADLERLKQPFQRAEGLQAVQGSGLGLALAVAVAEQYGGRLDLSKASQGGLRARLWLPQV